MRRILPTLLPLLFNAFCAVGAPAVPAFSEPPFNFKNELRGEAANYRTSREREGKIIADKKIIADNKSVAERKGEELVIKIKGKEPLRFKNEKKSPDGSVLIYFLVEVNSKSRAAVVELDRDETESYLAINYDTGESAELGSPPYWSPSGGRFAEMNGGVSDSSPALVHIWRADKTGFHKEWELTGYVAASGQWDDEDHIRFVMRRYRSERAKDEYADIPVERWGCRFDHAYAHTDHSWICSLDGARSRPSKKETEDDDGDY